MGSTIIKPPALRPGDTIGIAAPASPFNEERFEAGLDALRFLGFEVKIPEPVFERQGYLAGSDEQRAEVLMELFNDPAVRAVLCARGGFGSMRILPLLDFDVIQNNPKVLLGFSDITALLMAVYSRTGLICFHGPVVTTLAKGSSKTQEGLLEALTGSAPLRLSPTSPVVLRPGRALGRVLGGNLTTLTHLVGTPFEPALERHILFLEERGEAPYRIDRMLSQLRLGGLLDGVVGVMLGTFVDCGTLEDIYTIVKDTFRLKDIPILAGFEAGHGDENLTFPMGLTADLDTGDGSLTFQEAGVSEVSS